MKRLAGAVLIALAGSAPLLAQERDRSVERIGLALRQPSPFVLGVEPVERASPKKLGIFTLLPPTSRGEIVRVSVPVGELVMRAVGGIAAANRRRQEAAARRRVEAELRVFK